MKRVFKFAMPFLQASLVKQILVGLILGMALGLTFPDAAKSVGFLGTVFVMALKGVAPILVFVLVMSSIANQSDISQGNMHVKPIIVLYLVGTFLAAVIAVGASFLWPTEITLQAAQDTVATPGGIAEVFGNLILQAVDNPVHAIASGNYISILVWAIAMGAVLRQSHSSTIDFSCGKFNKNPFHRITELSFHQNGSIVEKRQNHDGTGMTDIFAYRDTSIRQPDPVSSYPKKVAFIDDFAIELRFCQIRIGKSRWMGY